MMIVKVNFSKGLLHLILCLAFLSACSTSNRAIHYTEFYKGESVNGAHSRAVAISDRFIVLAGQHGNLAVHLLDTTIQKSPIYDVVAGIEDFRDIYLTKRGDCLLMNAGENGILFGIAGGITKKKIYDTSGVFFDGMDFWDDQNGILFGDPIDGRFFIAKSVNNLGNWKAVIPQTMPAALENEAAFAASGSSIQAVGDSMVYFGTGMGEVARVFCSNDRGENWVVKDTPMRAGGSYGIYSLFFWSANEGMIIGGSYKDSTYAEDICFVTEDGGDSWQPRSKGLKGYCSSVHGTANGELIVATGRMGTFYSTNKGHTWDLLLNRSFYSCRVTDNRIVLTGRNGFTEILDYQLLGK